MAANVIAVCEVAIAIWVIAANRALSDPQSKQSAELAHLPCLPRLSHPDLTLANLPFDCNGGPISINV